MIDSRLAIQVIKDLPGRMKELEKSWEFFVFDNQTSNTIRYEVIKSWERCQSNKVDPFQKKSPIIMNDNKLTELTSQSELYNISKPIIDSFYQDIKGTEHLIVLSDHTGRIIHIRGDLKTENKAQKMNFVSGADWSEQIAGSNAIGTSIISGQPIQILAHEHYCHGVHPWACSGSPIRDPLTKEILGVINLTGSSHLTQPHSLSVVQSLANLIEQRLLMNAQNKLMYLSNQYEKLKNKRKISHVIILDNILNVVKGDSKIFQFLHISNWEHLWLHKDLKQLKKILLNDMPQREFEWKSTSLNLSFFIQPIILNSEQIGYSFSIEKEHLSSTTNNQTPLKDVIGESTEIYKIISKIRVIADTNVPVLLTGDSGTGKEVIARSIHQKSMRKKQPFIAINCGSFPDNLISSELFGYEAGAFTGGNPKGKIGKFEEANGGTLLLDEIGEMPVDLQVHLLRVLQEKEVVRIGSSKPIPIDVRIIATTNSNLGQLIAEKKFRSDLYFRLNVVELYLPKLKNRTGDINLLADYFASELAMMHEKSVPTINQNVLNFFDQYHWPGNIRELRNVMEYAVLFCVDDHITLDSLPNSIIKRNEKENIQFNPLELSEKKNISQLIVETNGNISEIARQCEIARTTLYRKIEKYALESLLNQNK